MGEDTKKDGLSRRDLIKRSAVAGAIVWAAPVIDSSAAWGQTPTDCNECNGLTLYSKYAPGNSNTVGNQCLAPCPPVTVISSSVLTACGLISTDDTVQSGANDARVTFSTAVRLIRTSIKSTNDCYMSSCKDNFASVRTYTPAANPPCNTEHTTGTVFTGSSSPLFKFYAPDPTTLCGVAPNGTGCASEIRRVDYDTNGVGSNGTPLNFIEILLCLKGTSVLPPGCTSNGTPN
jgi:hypothetical protein